MSETASLELKVSSAGFVDANKTLQETASIVARVEAAASKMATAMERSSAKQATAVESSVARESAAWQRATQQAKARYEAEEAAAKKAAAAKRDAAAAGSGSGAGGGIQALNSGFTQLVPKIAAAATAMAVLRKVVSETSAYDGLIARLTGVSGSADEARKSFDKLEELSDKTIFSENAITEAFIRMEQMGLEPTERTMKSFANIASATGGTMDQLAETTLQASMGMYRGLRQFGIKAEQEGDKLKVTFKGTTTTIANSADAITKYLVSIGETDFAGAAERQLDTMGGAVKKLEDAWGDMFREIGRSAVGDFIKTGMTEAAKGINLATEAIEALLYTMSQKPKFTGMSKGMAEWSKNASRWGESTDEESSFDTRIQDVIKGLESSHVGGSDKDLQEYLGKRSTLEEGMARGYTFDPAALDQLDKQYADKVNGGGKPGKEATVKKDSGYDILGSIDDANRKAFNERVEAAADGAQREYEAVRDGLLKQEAGEKESYEKRKKYLEDYTGDDQEELIARTEELWGKHLDGIAEREARNSEEKKRVHDDVMSTFMSDNERMIADEQRMQDEFQRMREEEIISETELAQLKVQLHLDTNQKISASNMELAQQSTQHAEALFGNLATAAKNWGGEQSDSYRAMFAAQKAFGIASAGVSMAVGIGKAMELGWPAGIPAGMAAAAEGARILAMLSSTNYSGAYDAGGDIPAGSVGLVGERRVELINRPTMIAGPAHVTGGAATAAMLGGGGGQPVIHLRVVNAPEGRENAYRTSSARERVVVNSMRRQSGAVQRILGGGY